MAINPIIFTEKVVSSFLKYQLTAYPFADEHLHEQMRSLLSLDDTRDTPLLKGPYISLSRSFIRTVAAKTLLDQDWANLSSKVDLCFGTLNCRSADQHNGGGKDDWDCGNVDHASGFGSEGEIVEAGIV